MKVMKELKEMKDLKAKRTYDPPLVEVIEVEPMQVMAASVGTSVIDWGEMKTRYTILSVAAAALAMTACSNEDELSLQQGDEVVRIASASVVNSAQTRVNSDGAGDTFESGDSFCLINKSRPNQNKGTYSTTDGSNWTQSG